MGIAETYYTRVQHIPEIWPTNGKVISCDWSIYNGVVGLVDLDTGIVYQDYLAATSAGAGRRLWWVWRKSFADIYFDIYLKTQYPLNDTNEYPYYEPGIEAAYMVPVAVLGVGIILDGTSEVLRHDTPTIVDGDFYFYRPCIVFKDNASADWSNNDLVYLLKSETGKTPTYTKTEISGAPTLRVDASASGVPWAKIKTIFVDAVNSPKPFRPVETVSMAESAKDYGPSDYFAPGAITTQKHGAIGGTLPAAASSLQGAEELVMFYSTSALPMELHQRRIDSRAYLASDGRTVSIESWAVVVAEPRYATIGNFINSARQSYHTTNYKNITRHEFAIDAGELSFIKTNGLAATQAPILSSKSFQIYYSNHEHYQEVREFIDRNKQQGQLISKFGIRIVGKVAGETPGPSNYTVGRIGRGNRFPHNQNDGIVMAQDGNGDDFFQRRRVSRRNYNGSPDFSWSTADYLWSHDNENIEWRAFAMYILESDANLPTHSGHLLAFVARLEAVIFSVNDNVLIPDTSLPTLASWKDINDKDWWLLGWAGTRPSTVSDTDIFSFNGRLTFYIDDGTPPDQKWVEYESAGTDGRPHYAQWNSPLVDRAQWYTDVMPMSMRVMGTDGVVTLRTDYHRGKAMILSDPASSPPTWPDAPEISVEIINYGGDAEKPMLVVTIEDLPGMSPTFPNGYVPEFVGCAVYLGGDVTQADGFSFDQFSGCGTNVAQVAATAFEFRFAIYPFLGNPALHKWHVPETGTLKVRIVAETPWADRKNPCMVARKEWLYEMPIPSRP